MEKEYPGMLIKRAALSRPSGQWDDDDFDVLANGEVVGRIYKANAAPVDSPWMWTLAFWHHEGRAPTDGNAVTREAAMAALELAEGVTSNRRGMGGGRVELAH